MRGYAGFGVGLGLVLELGCFVQRLLECHGIQEFAETK